MATIETTIKIDDAELDEATAKVERMREMLNEVKSLARDLTSKDIEVGVKVT